MKPSGVANQIPNSPVTLTTVRDAWRSIPEVPVAVQDAFARKSNVVLHRDRWRALVPRAGGNVFAWLDGRVARATGVSSQVMFEQTLESDERGRALVIAGAGNSLYAVEPSGHATCLGVLADRQKINTACWLPGGGVGLVLGREICIYTPAADGQLAPRIRFVATQPYLGGLRSLPSDDDDVIVIASFFDDRGVVYAIDRSGRVVVLADFDRLSLADVRLFLDETGDRTMLPDGPTVSVDANLTRVEGLAEALAERERLPEAELAVDAAPELEPGPDIAAPDPAQATIENRPTPLPDAHVAPSIDRLGELTGALIRMLRAAPKRSSPDGEILRLIRSGMPDDLRAYVHAWALHSPNNPAVYEFWMDAPRLETREFIKQHAGESIRLGIFASGEPIVARRSGTGSCEVVMIDEEGVPYRYRGLEGFLLDLQMRAPGDDFELDGWMK